MSLTEVEKKYGQVAPDVVGKYAVVIAGGDVVWNAAKQPFTTLVYFERSGENAWATKLPGRWRELVQKIIDFREGYDRAWKIIPYLYESKEQLFEKLRDQPRPLSTGFDVPGRIDLNPNIYQEVERVRYPFFKIAPVLREADVVFLNLETPISDRGRNAGGFRASASFADAMKWSGVDVVSTANNHALDREEIGILDTLEHLAQADVGAIGTGPTLDEARKPFAIEANGVALGFLAYSQWTNFRETGFALPDRSGVAPMDPILMLDDIKRLKAETDHVIVSLHWGPQGGHREIKKINSVARRIARYLVDNGASVIFGHGPHFPAGVEFYKKSVIYYSLGNFIFSHNYRRWQDNVLARVTVSTRGIEKAELLPISGMGTELAQPFLLQGDRALRTLEKVRRMSSEVDTIVTIDGGRGLVDVT